MEVQENTILQRLAEAHDSIPGKLRAAMDDQGKTYVEVAARTGIPETNIGRLMRGEQSRPTAFYIAAVCSELGLSADELLGLNVRTELPADAAELAEENARMRHEVLELRKDLEHEREKVAMREREIKVRRPLIYCLVALTAIMAMALIIYMAFDRSIPHAGLVKETTVSPLLFILICIILSAIAVSVYLIFNSYKTSRQKKSKNAGAEDDL